MNYRFALLSGVAAFGVFCGSTAHAQSADADTVLDEAAGDEREDGILRAEEVVVIGQNLFRNR